MIPIEVFSLHFFLSSEIRQGQRHAIADAAVQYGCNISPLVLFQDCHGFSKLCLAGTCKSLDGQFAADSRNNKMPSWKQDWLRCMVECLDSLMPFESRSQSVVFPTGWKRVLSSSLLSSVDILWYFPPRNFPFNIQKNWMPPPRPWAAPVSQLCAAINKSGRYNTTSPSPGRSSPGPGG